MCTDQDISNIPFIRRENHFRVHGHTKDLPHNTCIFHVFKYVVNFSVSHFTSHFFAKTLNLIIFKVSTFQPNFLCSSSFKWGHVNIFFNLNWRPASLFPTHFCFFFQHFLLDAVKIFRDFSYHLPYQF